MWGNDYFLMWGPWPPVPPPLFLTPSQHGESIEGNSKTSPQGVKQYFHNTFYTETYYRNTVDFEMHADHYHGCRTT